MQPLLPARVQPGRVVATGVQQHDAAARQRFEAIEHGLNVQRACLAVVIRVIIDPDARAAKDRTVVIPRRVAHPDLGIGESVLEKIRPHLDRAQPADRLDRRHAPGFKQRMPLAEQELLHLGAVHR